MSIVQRKIWLQSHDTDKTTKPHRSRYYTPEVRVFVIKEEKWKTNKQKIIAEGQRQYEMLTIFCYIALDSPESAARTVVLMKNVSDAFPRAVRSIHPDCI